MLHFYSLLVKFPPVNSLLVWSSGAEATNVLSNYEMIMFQQLLARCNIDLL